MRSYLVASAVIFDLLTAVQLVRLIMRWPITVNGVAIPLWASGVAICVVGSLAIWAFRLILRTRGATEVAP